MGTKINLLRGLDRKEWEIMTPSPVNTAAGTFTITDPAGQDRATLFVQGVSGIYRYDHNNDAWQQLPNSGIAGTFGAGACGTYHHLGPNGTATAGTTTTITTNLTINRSIAGYKIRITAGPGAGDERTILSNTWGANCVITVESAFSATITTSSTYQLYTGRYWFFNPSTTAPGFAYYDRALNGWTQRSVTGLPTSFGTDGRLVQTCLAPEDYFVNGTATSATSTTLVNSGKTWTVNQWTNYQVRITGGTGIGQIRVIASNTSTALTVSAWTVTPDATSTYVIEADENSLYLLGNNAISMYKYSISGNTWSTLSPGVARAGAMGTSGGANWISKVTRDSWKDESNFLNGRYIYSFRGGASAVLDRYDIAANSWTALTYWPQTETFTTGSSYDYDGDFIYIQKEATGRFFRLVVPDNTLYPFSTLVYPQSTAVVGDKMWTKTFTYNGVDLTWVYFLINTGNVLLRCLTIENDSTDNAGEWILREV